MVKLGWRIVWSIVTKRCTYADLICNPPPQIKAIRQFRIQHVYICLYANTFREVGSAFAVHSLHYWSIYRACNSSISSKRFAGIMLMLRLSADRGKWEVTRIYLLCGFRSRLESDHNYTLTMPFRKTSFIDPTGSKPNDESRADWLLVV